MSDLVQPQKLDLAQRILTALTCTEEPRVLDSDEDDLVGATKIYELSFHLRHLAVLHSDLVTEADAAKARFEEVENQFQEMVDTAGSSEIIQALIAECNKKDRELIQAENERDIVYNLIFASLEQYLPPIDEGFEMISIITDWSVFRAVSDGL